MLGVFNFVKETDHGSKNVQLILVKGKAYNAFAEYHSTCVMNWFSWNQIGCVFPAATLADRISMVAEHYPGRSTVSALKKYESRGYEIFTPKSARHQLSKYGMVDDKGLIIPSKIWLMDLSTDGIAYSTTSRASTEPWVKVAQRVHDSINSWTYDWDVYTPDESDYSDDPDNSNDSNDGDEIDSGIEDTEESDNNADKIDDNNTDI